MTTVQVAQGGRECHHGRAADEPLASEYRAHHCFHQYPYLKCLDLAL